MYEILMDGQTLWYPGDPECTVISPEIHEALNDSGYIQFTVPISNPLYSKIYERISMIQVLKDNREIFYGVVKETSVNMRRDKKVYAVGILSFLADSIQPQKQFQSVTPVVFINEIIQKHNEQVEEKKQFQLGAITVQDPNNSIYRYTNYENTLTALREKICEPLDGYLRVRRVDGKNILDVVTLQEYGKNCGQAIEFGENLLDYAENTSTDEIVTAVLPRGQRLEESNVEGLDAYVTIESVNDGKDFIYNEEAVKRFGWIKKVVDWDDVSLPENLIIKAREWLNDKQFANLTLELNAIDLSILDKSIQSFELGDYIHAIAEPFGMNTWFPVQEKVTYLSDPDKNTIVLSNTSMKSYTQQQSNATNKINNKLPQESKILQLAKQNASEIIKQATNGYIVLKMDDEGNPSELLIMDSKNPEDARRVWRWNLNGFGYSKTGYNGEYGLAITMDGAIVADFITTGTMYAERIHGGTLKLGGADNSNGVLSILNQDGVEVGKWDKDGITLPSNTKLSADQIHGGTLKLGGADNSNGVLSILNQDGVEVGKWDKDGITLPSNTKLSADQINGGTLQGVTIISKDSSQNSIKIDAGQLKGYQGNTEVGSLDYSSGTRIDGTLYPAMRWRAQQTMSIKTPKLFTAEDPSDTANVTRCISTEVKVVTGVSISDGKASTTTKTLKFINGLLVTA